MSVLRAVPKPQGRVRDEDYLDWIHTLACCLSRLGNCRGVIEASHLGQRPKGRKCDDDEAVPKCSLHHDAWTRHVGHFAGWTHSQRREWADEQIDIYQVTGEMVLSLWTTVASEKLDTQRVFYPADWWQALRQRWAPRWWLRRWPVRYTTVTIEARAYYPRVSMPEKQHRIALSVVP